MFKQLTSGEELDYREWARTNYDPGERIDPLWHPVVRDECHKINREADTLTERLLADQLERIREVTGVDYEFCYHLGGMRVARAGGSKWVSPRLTKKEMSLFLDGMEAGVNALFPA